MEPKRLRLSSFSAVQFSVSFHFTNRPTPHRIAINTPPPHPDPLPRWGKGNILGAAAVFVRIGLSRSRNGARRMSIENGFVRKSGIFRSLLVIGPVLAF
jgi:hypothetical protein